MFLFTKNSSKKEWQSLLKEHVAPSKSGTLLPLKQSCAKKAAHAQLGNQMNSKEQIDRNSYLVHRDAVSFLAAFRPTGANGKEGPGGALPD